MNIKCKVIINLITLLIQIITKLEEKIMKKDLFKGLPKAPYLLRDVKFLNLNKDAKKGVVPKISIDPNNHNIVFTRSNGFCQVIAYQDPKTGLLIADEALARKKIKTTGGQRYLKTNDQFIQEIINEIKMHWDREFKKLKKIHDEQPDKYEAQYRDLILINNAISEYLTDRYDLLLEINKQLKVRTMQDMPVYNTKLLFDNDDLLDMQTGNDTVLATTQVDYDKPNTNNNLAQERELVSNFLNVFVDRDSMKKLSWFFGATLNNEPINSSNISKMLVVTSVAGGCGKSTLIHGLVDNLITPEYSVNLPSFDQTFSKRDRFAASALRPARITTFDEANWCEDPTKDEHDFSDLYEDAIKSLISSGIIRIENKYSSAQMVYIPNMMIALTNFMPELKKQNDGMNRRLLDMQLKSTSMYDKGKRLKLYSDQEINHFIHQHRQAFADVFVDFYKNHRTLFTEYEYSFKRAQKNIINTQKETQHEIEQTAPNLATISSPIKKLQIIDEYEHLNLSTIIGLIKRKQEGSKDEQVNDLVHITDNHLYLSSNKDFLESATGNADTRKVFRQYFGKAIPKFRGRFYQIK